MGTSGSATYTYDLFNRQKTHTSGGVVTTTTYRPDGLRHSIGGTKHIWDGQNIVGEYVGTTYTVMLQRDNSSSTGYAVYNYWNDCTDYAGGYDFYNTNCVRDGNLICIYGINKKNN